jgi:hypothetical protein
MNPPNCTLITACYDLNKYNKKCRTTEECLALINPLLQIPVYLVIYGSRSTIPAIRMQRTQFGFDKYTQYIEIELEDLWAYQFLQKVKENRAAYWPTRDERTCAESHIVCCNKFDFVQETITINPFNTSHFGWIDAYLGDGKNGLRICENYDRMVVPRILHALRSTNRFHIQVLNCNDKRFKESKHKKEFYERYRWVTCGGFFVTAPEVGTKIMTRLKEIFVETTMQGFGHGEEMFYLEVLDEFYEDIARSYGDYGQMLNNFLGPTRNIEYVFHTIIQGFKNAGYEREYKDACAALLEAATNYFAHIDQNTYMEISQYIKK